MEFISRVSENPIFALWSPYGFITPSATEAHGHVYSNKPYVSGLSGIRTMRYWMMTRTKYETVQNTQIVKLVSSFDETVKKYPQYANSPMIKIWHSTGEIETRYENHPALDKVFSYIKHSGFVQEHLFSIEQHWQTHPDRKDRYFVIFSKRINHEKITEVTGLIGKKRFFYAPDKEALVLMKLFFDYPIEKIYDFEEQRSRFGSISDGA